MFGLGNGIFPEWNIIYGQFPADEDGMGSVEQLQHMAFNFLQRPGYLCLIIIWPRGNKSIEGGLHL